MSGNRLQPSCNMCPLKPVPQLTPIFVARLQHELCHHPNTDKVAYVFQGLCHGFCLGFNHTIHLKSASGNMSLAFLNPQVIDNYLQSEVQMGRVAGPFLEPPLSAFRLGPTLTEKCYFYLTNGLASSTCKLYSSAQQRFQVFCIQDNRLSPFGSVLPANEETLNRFCAHIADTVPHSTIKVCLPFSYTFPSY